MHRILGENHHHHWKGLLTVPGEGTLVASGQLISEDIQNTKSPKICNLKYLENNKLQQPIPISLWRTKVLMSQYSKHKP
jgi:hypothetical protein